MASVWFQLAVSSAAEERRHYAIAVVHKMRLLQCEQSHHRNHSMTGFSAECDMVSGEVAFAAVASVLAHLCSSRITWAEGSG